MRPEPCTCFQKHRFWILLESLVRFTYVINNKNMGREPIYLTELSLSNIPHMRANFPGRFCDASQFTSYDGTEVPIYLIWKRRRANLPLT